jgi:hypothetical protein
LPKRAHAKSLHHFELPQLAAWVPMMFCLIKRHRDKEEWLSATDQMLFQFLVKTCDAANQNCPTI